MASEMCELEKAFWDWFMKIKSNRAKMGMLPLNVVLVQPVMQTAIKKLGELHRELTERELWQKLY